MYLVEIHGKLSEKNENKEDILTSNVFSFFKYANREIFLFRLLKTLQLHVSAEDAVKAEFRFWPSFADGTQPDLVIIVGTYYLLIEAKYHSGFSDETLIKKHQLVREIEGGTYEAKDINKSLKIIVVTGDYVFNSSLFTGVPHHHLTQVTWINWQKIALLIFEILEQNPPFAMETRLFAEDLYKLLVKKNLRNFEGVRVLSSLERIYTIQPDIFFESSTAAYRGDFIGFQISLGILPKILSVSNILFYQRKNNPQNLSMPNIQIVFFDLLYRFTGKISKCKTDLFFRRSMEK